MGNCCCYCFIGCCGWTCSFFLSFALPPLPSLLHEYSSSGRCALSVGCDFFLGMVVAAVVVEVELLLLKLLMIYFCWYCCCY